MGEVAKTWGDVVQDVSAKFLEIANREKLVTWAEESQFALQAIQANSELASCAPHTVQNAIINVASVGLTLNPAYGYAYLVPESVKAKHGNQEVWIKECKLRISFKGLAKVATDSGSIKWVRAEVVCEGEEFEYLGPCSMPQHKIANPFARGKTIGVYCVAKTHEGDVLADIMGQAEIEKIKAKAKTKNVWNEWPDEMAKKAIIKRASKQWPKTDRMESAVNHLNESEGSENYEPPKAERVPETPQPEEPKKQLITDSRLSSAIEKINSGEYSVQRLNATFDLTPEQIERVQSECVIDGGEK